jgi:ketosteroid isomerase-like protein
MQRQTAEAVVDAFNRMDIDAIIAYRSDDCMRRILPSTLGHPPTNNKQYRASLERLIKIFSNFSLTINDVVEDNEARKICMYLKARADTLAGEYVNEYMWTLSFNASGTKIINATEFVDTVMNKDFWPLLLAAMKIQQGSESSTG